jgi:iron complex transport system substrate-binding protein
VNLRSILLRASEHRLVPLFQDANGLRIVSFLPAATEILCELGLADQLVGRSSECDFPHAVRDVPIVVRSALQLDQMTQLEIDGAVSTRLHSGQSLYVVDEELLRRLAPDLIITQDLCQVCAPSGNEITRALKHLDPQPDVLFLTPHSLDDVFGNIVEVGRATGRENEAEQIVAAGRARLEKVRSTAARAEHRPRVFVVEWIEPIYTSGHWVPEMVRIAGGVDTVASEGADSIRLEWNKVLEWAPDVVVVAPCGFSLAGALKEVNKLGALSGWSNVPAVRKGCVFAVDANAYFARPGPRLVGGTELLAHLIHPEIFSAPADATAFRRLAQK